MNSAATSVGAAALGVGLVDDLVVDVGDVLDQRHCEAAAPQPAAQHGEGDVGTGVADVHEVVHGGAAAVDADLARLARDELLFALRQRVEQADHATLPWSLDRPRRRVRRRRVSVSARLAQASARLPAGQRSQRRQSRSVPASRAQRRRARRCELRPVLAAGERQAQRHEQARARPTAVPALPQRRGRRPAASRAGAGREPVGARLARSVAECAARPSGRPAAAAPAGQQPAGRPAALEHAAAGQPAGAWP